MDEARFKEACRRVKDGAFAATNEQKLMLYALYKIATTAATQPAHGKPGTLDCVGRAKWDAWNEFGRSYDASTAPGLYVKLVDALSAPR